MDLSIILTVGKYAIIVALYAFVLVVFRGIMSQLATESRRGQQVATGARTRSERSMRSRPPARPAVAPRVILEPEPQPEPQSAPEPPPEPPAEPEPVPAPEPEAPAPQLEARPEPEPRTEPEPAPTISDRAQPPELAAAKIDLLAELQAEDEPEPVSEPEPVRASGAAGLLVIESVDETLAVAETVPLSAAVTIGRSDENSLQVFDRFISSRHVLICLRDGRRILVDRGSTNGTFVNGQRVEEEVELSDGDRIAMGNTVLEYHAG